MRLIVGLGNPGEKYYFTRHNAGWLALDHWLGEVSWTNSKRFNALTYQDGDCIYVKPLTFMNESGQAVRKIMDYYGLLPRSLAILHKKDAALSDVLAVVHDDLDIEFGAWRLATDSSSAGHRGVQSIIDCLKTKKFTRLRLGIKNDLLRNKIPADKFVLQNFNSQEKSALPEIFTAAYLKKI